MTIIKIRPLLALGLLFPLTALAARPVVVVATNMILADLVREVGGDEVLVLTLAKTGADLHDFEPKPADVSRLKGADIVVMNGLGLEPWFDKFVRNSGFRGDIVVATRGVDVIESPGACDAAAHQGHDHPADPHAWHDPAAARTYVGNIRAALARAAPEVGDFFAAREADFLSRLDRLDASARAEFAALPASRRRMVTSHDSLAYLGRAYGIEMIPVSGAVTAAEPNARRVAEIIDLVRDTGVAAIFIDSGGNPALVERIAADSGVKLAGRLLTDSLDEPGHGTDTYLAMMEQNLRRILDSLK